MEKFNPCDVCLYSTTKDSKAAMCYRCDLYKLKVENEYLSEFESKMRSYMDDSKKNKIIHGLQKCSSGKTGIEECHGCPYEGEKEPRPCYDNLSVDAFNLVISQKAELDRYKSVIGDLAMCENGDVAGFLNGKETKYIEKDVSKVLKELAVKMAKAEAYKDVEKKLKEHLCLYDLDNYHTFRAVDEDTIEDIISEMIGKGYSDV